MAIAQHFQSLKHWQPFKHFKQHRLWLLMGLLLWLLGGVLAPPVTGAPLRSPAIDLASQPITEIRVSLGDPNDALRFEPEQFNFQSGKRYKLILSNPSHLKHYFTAKDFADSIWTQKVDTGGVEIKGAIHDLEIRPGGSADWVFVPVRPGRYDLQCHIAGHAEAGMIGKIVVSATPS
jgi:uncharacterized cupredoxin-like copper-binding protein